MSNTGLPTISLVKPDQFDEYRWWEPQRLWSEPRWFYGMKESQRASKHPTPDTVDAPLRELVEWCRSKGIGTLPSCAGHFPTERGLRRVYLGLRKDAVWVQSYGLTLRCSESGTLQVYRNPEWKVPDYETWAAPIRRDAGNGRIGVIFPVDDPRRLKVIQALRGIEGVCAFGRPFGVEITVKSKNKVHRAYLWACVTRCVTSI